MKDLVLQVLKKFGPLLIKLAATVAHERAKAAFFMVRVISLLLFFMYFCQFCMHENELIFVKSNSLSFILKYHRGREDWSGTWTYFNYINKSGCLAKEFTQHTCKVLILLKLVPHFYVTFALLL